MNKQELYNQLVKDVKVIANTYMQHELVETTEDVATGAYPFLNAFAIMVANAICNSDVDQTKHIVNKSVETLTNLLYEKILQVKDGMIEVLQKEIDELDGNK